MRTVLVTAVAVGMLLVAGPASSSSSTSAPWVVVGHQHGILLAASNSGVVRVVHGRAGIGARVTLRGNIVAGIIGHTRHAFIRGVVVRHTGALTFISAANHLLVVHMGRRLASTTDTSPTPGTVVQQSVSIDDQGELDDQGEQDVGNAGQVQVQASVSSIGTGTVTLIVNGQTLTIPLPAGLTLPTTLIGTTVTLNVSFANGQATANEQGDDDNQQGDDDNQGDQQTTTTTTTTSGGDDDGGGGGD